MYKETEHQPPIYQHQIIFDYSILYRTTCAWANIFAFQLQWLKKLSQCLLIMEKHMHYSMMTRVKNMINLVSNLWHSISNIHFGLCNFNQNSWSYWINKMVTYWGNFLTIHFWAFFLSFWGRTWLKKCVKRINKVMLPYLYYLTSHHHHESHLCCLTLFCCLSS